MKIPNYSNYEIYPKEGKIWSYKSNRFIGSKRKNGYYACNLTADDGTVWATNIHRVVWIAVNGEIPNGLVVNHIDEDKSNNSIDNLNLMTYYENNTWGTRIEKMVLKLKGSKQPNIAKAKKGKKQPNIAKAKSKQVGAYKDGELMMTFQSVAEAGRQGYSIGNIASCCNGLRSQHKGFQWRYI